MLEKSRLIEAQCEQPVQEMAAVRHLEIIFELAQSPESGEEEILLLAVGSHDEVY